MPERQPYLVAYDIADPRRLRLAWLSTPARENLVTQLATLGRQLLPGGVHLFQSGARLTDNDAES